jgi:hypothetical protein
MRWAVSHAYSITEPVADIDASIDLLWAGTSPMPHFKPLPQAYDEIADVFLNIIKEPSTRNCIERITSPKSTVSFRHLDSSLRKPSRHSGYVDKSPQPYLT